MEKSAHVLAIGVAAALGGALLLRRMIRKEQALIVTLLESLASKQDVTLSRLERLEESTASTSVSSCLNKLNIKMPVPSDIEIAQSVELTPISDLFGRQFGLKANELFAYGTYKGKLSLSIFDRLRDSPNGHYVVVSGINPTPLGEGKSTTTVVRYQQQTAENAVAS